MTQSFKPHCFVLYKALIGNHRKLQILDDLITKFCHQFYFLIVMWLLNSFKSEDHTRATWHIVFCMNHHIHLLLTAGQSRTDAVKSLKTTPLVWYSGAPFGLTPFCADFIDYMEHDSNVKDSSKFNKIIGFGTTYHKFPAMNGGLLFVPVLTISHQLRFLTLSSSSLSSTLLSLQWVW